MTQLDVLFDIIAASEIDILTSHIMVFAARGDYSAWPRFPALHVLRSLVKNDY